jgi:hypothetical protein
MFYESRPVARVCWQFQKRDKRVPPTRTPIVVFPFQGPKHNISRSPPSAPDLRLGGLFWLGAGSVSTNSRFMREIAAFSRSEWWPYESYLIRSASQAIHPPDVIILQALNMQVIHARVGQGKFPSRDSLLHRPCVTSSFCQGMNLSYK